MTNEFLSGVIAAMQVTETGNCNYIHTHDRVWIERQGDQIRVKAEAVCINEYGGVWGCGFQGQAFLPLEDEAKLPFMGGWRDLEPVLGKPATEPSEDWSAYEGVPVRVLKSGKKT